MERQGTSLWIFSAFFCLRTGNGRLSGGFLKGQYVPILCQRKTARFAGSNTGKAPRMPRSVPYIGFCCCSIAFPLLFRPASFGVKYAVWNSKKCDKKCDKCDRLWLGKNGISSRHFQR